MPKIYTTQLPQQKKRLLKAYVQTYLKEEILEETIVRKVGPFTKFLEVSAQMNGEVINKSAIAKDCGIADQTVAEYYQILEDTLLVFRLDGFSRSIRKQLITSPKYFLFDFGVINT